VIRAAVLLSLSAAAFAQSPLPEDANRKIVEKVCVDCHGAENFVNVRHDKDGWDKVVNEMVEKGATGTDEEFDKVVAYLVKYFGPEKPKR
jgi:cytochrome c5